MGPVFHIYREFSNLFSTMEVKITSQDIESNIKKDKGNERQNVTRRKRSGIVRDRRCDDGRNNTHSRPQYQIEIQQKSDINHDIINNKNSVYSLNALTNDIVSSKDALSSSDHINETRYGNCDISHHSL